MRPNHSVCVIIPAYNAQEYIAEALDSVAIQHRPPDRILVVDDGSTDKTCQTVEFWIRAHTELRVSLIRQEKTGVAGARNRGLLECECDLIALLDADDLMLPAHLSLLAGAFDVHPGLVIAFADQQVFTGESGTVQESFISGKRIDNEPYSADESGFRLLIGPAYSSLIWGNYIPTSGSVLRRQSIIEAGLYDTSLETSEDRDLLLRVSRLGGVGYFPEVLARKRDHDSNLTHDRHTERTLRNAFSVIVKQLADSKELKLTDSELAITRQALNEAAAEWLYTQSLRGAFAVAAHCGPLIRHGFARMLLDPRVWLRGVVRRFRR